MADFEALQIRFGKLDTKSDARSLPPGTLTLAENCQTQTDGVYKKRFGFTALAVNLPTIMRVAALGSQLLACDGTVLANYDPAGVPTNNGWHGVGTVIPTAVSQKSVLLDQSTDIDRSTTATTNGVRADSWIDSSGFVTVQLSNEATGGLIARTLVDSTGVWNFIHSVVLGNYVAVYFASTAMQKLYYVLVDTAAETIGASTVFTSGAAVNGAVAVMDAVAVSSTEVIVAWSSNTPNVRVARHAPISGTTVAGPTAVSGETADIGMAVAATDGEFGAVLYHSAVSGGMRAACFNPATTAQTVAPFMVEADPAGVPVNINGALIRQDATHVRAFWDWGFVAVTTNPYSRWTEISSAGAVGTLRALQNSRLASKAYSYGGNIFINLAHQGSDTLNSGLLTTNVTVQTLLASAPPARPIALHGFRSIYGALPAGQLPDVSSPAAGVYRFNSQLAYKFLAAATPRRALVCFTTSFVEPKRMLPLEVNNNVLFADGAPLKYDGVSATENNFIYAPDIIAITAGAVGAGGMDNGTRSYKITFESADAQGNTALSTTSLPRSATTTAGAGLGKVTLVISQTSMTRLGWTTNAQQGVIAVWRTTNGGTNYFLVTTIKIDPTVGATTYVDQAQDSAILGNRELYTNGAALDREPPPPSTHLVQHQGRVWGISAADPKVVFYSGDIKVGEDIWFAAAAGGQVFRVEPGGNLTALASLDEKLILFKQDRIFKVTGRGQNQLAQNNDLSLPQLVSSDCGCVDPRSVVKTSDGIMFRGEKGIYLLNRSEQVIFIGAAVDYFTTNYSTMTSAIMVPDRQEVRFTVADPVAPLVTPAGVTLVYNYASDSWTTWPILDGTPAVDAVVVDSTWHWAKNDGTVYEEDATTFLDAGAFVPMTLETAWIQPSGSQGLARVNRVMSLGQSRSDHGFEMQVAINYSDAYTMDTTWDAATISALPLEQLAFHLPEQKGESFRVRINDFADGTSPGEGFWTTGILLKAKPIRGAFDKLLTAGAKT